VTQRTLRLAIMMRPVQRSSGDFPETSPGLGFQARTISLFGALFS
jgi:hypothetical protein